MRFRTLAHVVLNMAVRNPLGDHVHSQTGALTGLGHDLRFSFRRFEPINTLGVGHLRGRSNQLRRHDTKHTLAPGVSFPIGLFSSQQTIIQVSFINIILINTFLSISSCASFPPPLIWVGILNV